MFGTAGPRTRRGRGPRAAMRRTHASLTPPGSTPMLWCSAGDGWFAGFQVAGEAAAVRRVVGGGDLDVVPALVGRPEEWAGLFAAELQGGRFARVTASLQLHRQ